MIPNKVNRFNEKKKDNPNTQNEIHEPGGPARKGMKLEKRE